MKKTTKKIVILTAMSLMAILNATVVNAAAASPPGVDTTALDSLVTIVFWVVRIGIIAVGAIPGTVKIVQGQADENPRDRNAGIASLVVAGVVFASTFAIEALI